MGDESMIFFTGRKLFHLLGVVVHPLGKNSQVREQESLPFFGDVFSSVTIKAHKTIKHLYSTAGY